MSRSFVLKSLKGKPGRSVALVLLSFFLCFCILGGSLVLMGLRSGLRSLDERLGADIMVVPYKAATQNYLEDAILMGNSGFYYMTSDKLSDIQESVDGVAQMSPQLFVATTTSSCCSYKVSIVGFDPSTDFTITPWVQNSYHGTLDDYEVFVGHTLNAYAGDTLSFFGVPVKVAARLDETGTYLDTAVYTNMNTVKALIAAAKERGLFLGGGTDLDPDTMVSCIMVKVADGYTAAEVEGEIKLHVNKVATVKTETTVEDVSNKLNGIQSMAVILIAVVWALIFIIEIIAFHLNFAGRIKDFAIIRVMGASRRELAGILMQEAAAVSIAGSVIGAAVSLLVVELFSTEIENSLNLPFLLPTGGNMVLIVALAVIVSITAGIVAALFSAHKAGNVDAALILRGDN